MLKKFVRCPLCGAKLMEDCTNMVTDTNPVIEGNFDCDYIIKCWRCKQGIEVRKGNKTA